MLSLPGPLVSVDWLAAHRADPNLRIADVRWSLSGPPGRERYAAGHIPGAVFLDADRELSSPGAGPGRHPDPVAGEAWPTSSAPAASATATSSSPTTTRAAASRPVSGGSSAISATTAPARCSTAASEPGPMRAMDWSPIRRAIRRQPGRPPTLARTRSTPRRVADELAGDLVLLDARAGERYRGETEPIDPRAGHIPGALSAPWSANLGTDGRFLAAEALRERYAALGGGRTANGRLLRIEPERLARPARARACRIRRRSALRRIVERLVVRPIAAGGHGAKP